MIQPRGDVEYFTFNGQVGDDVFGDDPTAWDVADWAGTNAWQVLTGIGRRVPRVYLEDGRVIDVSSPFAATPGAAPQG